MRCVCHSCYHRSNFTQKLNKKERRNRRKRGNERKVGFDGRSDQVDENGMAAAATVNQPRIFILLFCSLFFFLIFLILYFSPLYIFYYYYLYFAQRNYKTGSAFVSGLVTPS